jgi:hypothetical protein
LVIDEFQNFGTHAVSTILSESGKRGLSLTLAHQFLSQLDEEVRDAVLGNCSTIVSFRVGAEDAAIIGRAIDVAPQALMDLGRGKAYRRTLLNDAPSEAQYLETREAELPAGRFEANVRMTRAKYARTGEGVENIMQRSRDGAGGKVRELVLKREADVTCRLPVTNVTSAAGSSRARSWTDRGHFANAC